MKTVKDILKEAQDHLSKFDPRFPSGYPSDKQMPAVIILKRKAIRTFPDHQKIGLYYSQQLDKYVSIPFDETSKALGIHVNESKQDDDKVAKQLTMFAKRDKSSKEYLQSLHSKVATRVKGGFGAHLEKELQGGLTPYKTGRMIGHTVNALLSPLRGRIKPVEMKAKEEPRPEKKSKGPDFSSLASKSPTGVKPESKPETKVPLNEPIEKKVVPLQTRSEKETMARMKQIKRKFPSTEFSAGAEKAAGMKENFKSKLKALREEKQQVDEIAPLVAAGLATVAAPLVKRGLGYLARRGAFGKTIQKFANRPSGKDSKDSGSEPNVDTSLGFKRFEKQSPEHQFKSDLTRVSSAAGPSSKERYDTAVSFGTPSATIQRSQERSYLSRKQMDESNLNVLKKIVKENLDNKDIIFEDNKVTVNNRIAKKIINIYESLNRENRKKLEHMLNEDIVSFRKVINFAVRQ